MKDAPEIAGDGSPSFDITPDVVFRLGDELITDELQALIELVKNSYDASATEVRVQVDTFELIGLEKGTAADVVDDNSDGVESGEEKSQALGWLEVSDNGDGMDRSNFDDGWLLISGPGKREMKRAGVTNRLNRTPLGDKGLGRLGVFKIGSMIEIRTRPRSRSEEHILRFSREDFESQIHLSDVKPHYEVKELKENPEGEGLVIAEAFGDDVSCSEIEGKHGTAIRVSVLADVEVWRDHVGVQSEMLELISPFKAISDFDISLEIDAARGTDPIELGELADQRLDLARGRWAFQFDGQSLLASGKYKLEEFRPSASNQNLTTAWQELVRPDRGSEFLKRVAEGPLKDYKVNEGKSPWWLNVEVKVDLKDIGAGKTTRKRAAAGGSKTQWADPGPFSGELSTFSRRDSTINFGESEIFDSQSAFRDWIDSVKGIHVYRDGFGVRTKDDYLDLADTFTSAPSFYALRPGNIVGYVAITAAHNGQLAETTDREGFVENPNYETFRAILKALSDRITLVQTGIGRELGKWAEERGVKAPQSVSEMAGKATTDFRQTQARTASLGSAARELKDAVDAARDAPGSETGPASKVLDEASEHLAQLPELISQGEKLQVELDVLAESSVEIERERDQLRDQLREAHQTVGLGLIAEAVAHEMTNITGRLQARADAVAPELKGPEHRPARVLLTEARKTVRAIRLQIKHLEPQLRYQRSRRQVINLLPEIEEVADYHRSRFGEAGINVDVGGQDFTVRMNRGRLQQALDNLFLNSEFWLAQGGNENPAISITLNSPTLSFRDNGPGIDPSLGASIFQPFVSGRPGKDGRGLGLFITEQVLADDDSTIYLGNADDDHRQRTFVIDFTEAIEGG